MFLDKLLHRSSFNKSRLIREMARDRKTNYFGIIPESWEYEYIQEKMNHRPLDFADKFLLAMISFIIIVGFLAYIIIL